MYKKAVYGYHGYQTDRSAENPGKRNERKQTALAPEIETEKEGKKLH